MTMFKTREQIEEIREKFYKWFRSTGYFPHAQGISDVAYIEGYIEGYTQAQQDIKEACSEGFDKWWNSDKDVPEILGRASQALSAITNMAQRCSILSEFWAKEAYQAARLSSMKELQEKDEEIDRLKKKISSFDAYASADEKYQEAVKDIKWLLSDCDQELYTHLDKIDEIKTKYGLIKQESKE